MFTVSAAYLAAIRGPHQAYGYVEAYYNGAKLSYTTSAGDTATRLPLIDGAVTVDGSTPGVRRTLSITLAAEPGLWDKLSPIGTELRASTVLRYPSGATETIPQGVFDVDAQRMGYAVSGDLQITAPDRWARIQRARFFTPRNFSGGTIRARISALLLEALPAGTNVTDTSTSTDTVPKQTIDQDRAQFVQDLAKSAAIDVYFGRDGSPIMRNTPQIDVNNPVWLVDASDTGVLIDASRQRDRTKTYNVIIINGDQNNGSAPFATQAVWDNVTTSVTFAGGGTGSGAVSTIPDPSTAGPFGQRPAFYSSPLVTSASQAVNAGRALLAKSTGLAAQLSLSSISNPALDDGDTIKVLLPAERRDKQRPVEYHIVDTLTVPLVPTKTPMSIDTRSTRADDLGLS